MSNYNPAGGGLQYRGTAASAPPNCNFSKVDPTTGNKHNVSLLDFWLNVVTRDVFVLVALTTLNGATWVKLSTGGGGGVASVIGGHDINITGTATNPIVNINNAITLGDLSLLTAGNDAITAVSGDITLSGTGVNAAGNINLPNTSTSGGQGEIKFGGNRFISNFGAGNTFVGQTAGNTTLTGAHNSAFGSTALLSITTGAQNCAFGLDALLELTTSPQNVAIGSLSLDELTTGAGNNTAVGQGSGESLLTGAYNCFFGSSAGQNYTTSESSNVCISNEGTIADNNTIRIGTQGSGDRQQNSCFVAGIVGVTTSNSQMVTVDSTTGQLGAAALPTGSGALTLLQTQVASSATELDFTTGITSTYNNYLILGSNITTADVGAVFIQLQVSTDGGITYDTTNYTSGFSTLTTGMDYAVSNDNTQYTFSPYYLTNVTSGSGYVLGSSNTNFFDTSGSTTSTSVLFDAYTVINSTVNAFRLISSTGGAFSGTFSLYGYNF